MVTEVAVQALGVALDRDRIGHVDDDGVDEYVVALGEPDERGSGALLDVGGVDDGEQPAAQPRADDVVQHVEGVRGGRLVVLVVGHQAAAEIAGHDLGGQEVLASERRLTAPRDADEHDEAHGGNGELSHASGPSG